MTDTAPPPVDWGEFTEARRNLAVDFDTLAEALAPLARTPNDPMTPGLFANIVRRGQFARPAYSDLLFEPFYKIAQGGIVRRLVTCPPQHSKAHPYRYRDANGELRWTMVPANGGWKRWADLVVGDTVYGRNGQPTKVTAIWPQGVIPMRRITFVDGTTVDASLDHLWHVRSSSKRWEGTVSTADIEHDPEAFAIPYAEPTSHWPEPLRTQLAATPGHYSQWRHIIKVEPVEDAEAMCITVDAPDHLYVVGEDFHVTHNSWHCSVFGPAWLLRQRPDLRIGIVSYAANLSQTFTRVVRNLLAEHHPVFAGLKLTKGSASSASFGIEGFDGGMVAVGIGGGLSGKPVDVLILDDLLSGNDGGISQLTKDSAWDWVQNVGFARITNKTSVIGLGTRYAEDDPIGRILAAEGATPEQMQTGGQIGNWEYVRLPAIAEENDMLGRQPGEPLWPEQQSLALLTEKMPPKGDIYTWEAVYQGNPVPRTGRPFSPSNATFFRPSPGLPGHVDLYVPTGTRTERIIHRFATVDLASSLNQTADETVVSTWDITEKFDLVWRGMNHVRLEGPQQIPLIRAELNRYGGQHLTYIESVAYQQTMVQAAIQAGLPAEAIKPKGDKLSRSTIAQSLWRARKVFLPADAEWAPYALKQLRDFPLGGHDDVVDTLSYAAIVATTLNL